jgi:CRP-like cAMP-binding protein
MSNYPSSPLLYELFTGLSPEDQAALEQIASPVSAPRGRIFYGPDDVCSHVYILHKGIVQFYRISSEGKKLVVCTLNDAGLFGEMSLLGYDQHDTFAEAFSDCLLCTIKFEDLERVMAERPQIAERLLTIAGERLRRAEEQLEALAFKSIPVRLAARLLQLAGERDEVVGLTHQDLAEMIGTYRETTTQTLNDMKAAGLIAIGRRRLKLLDKEALRHFVGRQAG